MPAARAASSFRKCELRGVVGTAFQAVPITLNRYSSVVDHSEFQTTSFHGSPERSEVGRIIERRAFCIIGHVLWTGCSHLTVAYELVCTPRIRQLRSVAGCQSCVSVVEETGIDSVVLGETIKWRRAEETFATIYIFGHIFCLMHETIHRAWRQTRLPSVTGLGENDWSHDARVAILCPGLCGRGDEPEGDTQSNPKTHGNLLQSLALRLSSGILVKCFEAERAPNGLVSARQNQSRDGSLQKCYCCFRLLLMPGTDVSFYNAAQ